ncbi:WXG100 family type VII secretion target [Micromonospora sp. NPDC005174]|uniref:WXG100 family type VII secretion target n=1 Tax=unclassified Micromonospora TaxID=2617518 RepID=UPI0033B8F4EF
MSEITSADIPGVHGVADRLGTAGDRLGDALRALQRDLDAVYGCWGDDDAGKSFANNYVGTAEQQLADLATTVETLGGVADNLDVIADAFQQLDAQGGGSLELTSE